MYVLKFGGTSLATADSILKTIEITKERLKNRPVIVVVSAFGGVTNKLLEMANFALQNDVEYKAILKALEERHLQMVKNLIDPKRQSGVLANVKFLFNDLSDILQGVFLIQELSPKTNAYISSFGERLSAYIISHAYQEENIPSTFTDSREIIFTNDNYKDSLVDFEQTNLKIKSYFERNLNTVHIITGFIANNLKKKTTTLGRGGSDYTASILAASLGAEKLEIWTDVNGIMTADPKKVKKALTLKHINYLEAIEMSYFGAKILHAKTVQPVYKKNIPILIKNTFNPSHHGTLVNESISNTPQKIKGISSMQDIALVTLSGSGIVGVTGSANRMFSVLSEHNINIILISQASSEHSITVAVKTDISERASQILEKEFHKEIRNQQINKVNIVTNLIIIAIVGSNMREIPGVAGTLFKALGKSGVNVLAIAQGSSEMNISFVVKKQDERKSLNLIHEAFFLSDTKQINLFIVGSGQIAKTLIKQLIQAQKKLLQEQHLEIRLVGLINSRKMLIAFESILLSKALKYLDETDKVADLDAFTNEMIEYNLRNSIFVDCTASSRPIPKYTQILNKSISIVTPNKVACSMDYTFYKKLKNIVAKRGIPFLYETNVGAGLPIVSTIQDLINSGDKVLKIEAILSGTLNYIFNHVSSNNPLSKVVKSAKENGLTEPDPRVDLGLIDVARKILILARECGAQLELEDIDIEPFIPKKYLSIENVNDFLNTLSQYDPIFKQKLIQVEKENKKYSVIATFEEGKAKVSLQTINAKHPFFNVKGSDNIFLFKTERYNDFPLIIKGAGAGSEVTSAGVFADILRIANWHRN